MNYNLSKRGVIKHNIFKYITCMSISTSSKENMDSLGDFIIWVISSHKKTEIINLNCSEKFI